MVVVELWWWLCCGFEWLVDVGLSGQWSSGGWDCANMVVVAWI